MNGWNHFLVSLDVLLILFGKNLHFGELIIFSLVFGVLIDVDLVVGKYLLGRKPRHLRSWVQEPFGLIVLGVPIGLVLSRIKPEYFFLTLIPYLSHLLLDYLTIHEVSPLAPFSKKTMKFGFFRAFPAEVWYTRKEKGISESYVTLIFIIVLALVWLLI